MSDITPLAALLGGLLTLLAPCSVMLLPTFFAYAFTSRTTLIGRTLLFWLGLLTTLLPLGAAAGTLGATLRAFGPTLTLIAAICIIALGIIQILAIELPKVRLPWAKSSVGVGAGGAVGLGAQQRQGDSASPLSIYLLGSVYGLAGVGCAGPILGAVLLAASLGSDPLRGAFMMALYATGMALPLGVLALMWQGLGVGQKAWLRPRPLVLFGRHTTWTNVFSGAFFCILGVGLLIFGANNPLGSLVGTATLASWETQLLAATGRIPWWVLLVVVVLLGAALFLVFPRGKDASHEGGAPPQSKSTDQP